MEVTPAPDGKAPRLCLGEPGPTHLCCSATRPKWSGSPTYSWGSGIASGSSGYPGSIFQSPQDRTCSAKVQALAVPSAAERPGGHTCDRLCLTSALQGPSHGLMAGRGDQLNAGGLGRQLHAPSALTTLPGPYFLSMLTEGAARMRCTFPKAL